MNAFLVRVAFVVAMVSLSGCQRPERQITTSFDSVTASRYNIRGTGAIRGSALLRQQGGGVVTCAGNDVILMPDIPFVREALRIVADGGKPVANPPGTYPNAFRQGFCDAQGFFEFRELAAGQWVVLTEVQWTVGYSRQGGVLAQYVTLADGEDKQIVLNDSARLR